MMRNKSSGRVWKTAGVILLLMGLAEAVPFGNPANLPPKGSIEVSADVSKQFLFTRNDNYSSKYVPHQFFLMLGYTPFKWIMINGYLGASDADWYWKPNQIPDEIFLDGSWEMSPGIGVKVLPPVKFEGIGFLWHIFAEAKYVFIRSRYSEYMLPSGMWTLKMKSDLNQFEMGGFVVGYNRRYRVSFYGGLAARYVSASAYYTAISAAGRVYKGTMNMGTSFGNTRLITMAVFPVVGINWHINETLSLDIEASLLNIEKSSPLIGLSAGFSQFKR